MNIEIIDSEFSGTKSICCENNFYKRIPVEQVHEFQKKRAAQMPCEDVVVDCVSCIYERMDQIWINVKCDPAWRDFWRSAFKAIVPAYHMNKEHWNSIILDGTIPQEDIERLILESYELTKPKKKENRGIRQSMDGTIRNNIKIGTKVLVVQKQDQRTGKLTEGIVMRLLTNSSNHPRGIKVMLEGGIVGRVQKIMEDSL